METRRALAADDVAWLAERHDVPCLAAVAEVTATREIDGKATTAGRSALLSKPPAATRVARIAGAHGQIENRLSWELDGVMGEDGSRGRHAEVLDVGVDDLRQPMA